MQKSFVIVGVLLACLVGLSAERVEAQCSGETACVDSKDIADRSIRAIDLSDDAVNARTIADEAVTQEKIADEAVTQKKMANDSVPKRALMDAAVTQEKIADEAVTEEKIADNAVRGRMIVDGSVGNQDLAANAVRGNRVVDNSLTELDFSVANRVVVAKAGGDFTSISEALASIRPTATNPYVIEVMPGTYVDNVTMKSNVHLRGAGRDVVTITHNPDCGFCNVIQLLDVFGVEISGIAVEGAPPGASGIYVQGGSRVTIRGNAIRSNGQSENEGLQAYGIFIRSARGTRIIDNFIESNFCLGLATELSAPEILRNFFGGQFTQCDTGARDIDIVSGLPHISFNVVDSIFGSGGVGQYNVTRAGDPIAVP